MKLLRFVVAMAMAACSYTSHSAGQGKPLPLLAQDFARVIADPDNDTVFQDFLGKLPQVTLGTDAKRTYYVLEGDLLLTTLQVRASLRSYANDPRPALPTGELKVMIADGKPVFWQPGQRSLTYAVDRQSFNSQSNYQLVVANMALATQAWMDACSPCGLNYTHKAELDDHPIAGVVTFIVTFSPSETNFIASSFFPNDPLDRRYLIVAPSYFATNFDKVGVFRHELGHINGYRHEHIANVPGCFTEDNQWKPLTAYDPHSVMHYFCGGGGTMNLNLTDSDKAGHRALYHLN